MTCDITVRYSFINDTIRSGSSASENVEKSCMSEKNAVWCPSTPPSFGACFSSYILSNTLGAIYVPKVSLKNFLSFCSCKNWKIILLAYVSISPAIGAMIGIT